MKSILNQLLCTVLLISLVMVSCDVKGKKKVAHEKSTNYEEVKKDELISSIDPALNPIKVGKEFSKVFGDTLNIQLYELTMKPGDSVGLHQHLDHAVYVLEGGKLMVYVNGTDPVEFDLQAGVGFVGGPLTDSAINIGDTTVKLVITEVFRPRE